MRKIIKTKEHLNKFIAALHTTTLGNFTYIIDDYITDKTTKQKLTAALGGKTNKKTKMSVAKKLASKILKFNNEHEMFAYYSAAPLCTEWMGVYSNRNALNNIYHFYVEGDRIPTTIEGIFVANIDFEPERYDENFNIECAIQNDIHLSQLNISDKILKRTVAVGAAICFDVAEKWHEKGSVITTNDLISKVQLWFEFEFDVSSPSQDYDFNGSAKYRCFDLANIVESELFKLMLVEINCQKYEKEILNDGFKRSGYFKDPLLNTVHWDMDQGVIIFVNKKDEIERCFCFSSDINKIYKEI